MTHEILQCHVCQRVYAAGAERWLSLTTVAEGLADLDVLLVDTICPSCHQAIRDEAENLQKSPISRPA